MGDKGKHKESTAEAEIMIWFPQKKRGYVLREKTRNERGGEKCQWFHRNTLKTTRGNEKRGK